MDGDAVAIARMHERHAHFLQLEINGLRREHSARYAELMALRKKAAELEAENVKLKQRIAELTGRPPGEVERVEPPSFVKPNVPEKVRRKPGRQKGHAVALRPRPAKINVRQKVALPVDAQGEVCCPHCRTQLSELKRHRRIDGKNGQLWVVTNDTHTLYHVDRSRSGKVIAGLLGETFEGTLVSDFYAAERALRPAVVMRKITGGSRSEAGAQAWAILASIMRTAEQQGLDILETIRMLLRAAWSGKKIPLLINTS